MAFMLDLSTSSAVRLVQQLLLSCHSVLLLCVQTPPQRPTS
jgi:hypothetical protein